MAITAGEYKRAEVNGIRIYNRRAGEGPALVLLHGFPETSYVWRKVMPTLAEHTSRSLPPTCASAARPTARTTDMTDGRWRPTFTGLCTISAWDR